jgi:hypothetical protein
MKVRPVDRDRLRSAAPKRPRGKRNHGRDYLLVRLINGATKAAVHVDKRKAAAKTACRGKARQTSGDE